MWEEPAVPVAIFLTRAKLNRFMQVTHSLSDLHQSPTSNLMEGLTLFGPFTQPV